ncbi:hypothetical protein MCEMSHM24_02452 [Comamonadaceae bacterium]
MKKHRLIVEQLEAMNFIQMPNQSFTAPTGAYFLHAVGQAKEVEKYLTARYLARVDRYELMFGLNCPTLRDYYKNTKIIANPVAEAIAKLDNDRPYCWYRLPIRFGSRLNSWSCPAQASEMEKLFSNDIGHFVDELVISIDSAGSLLHTYLKDETPFEWRLGTSYFARMCEVAYLVAYTRSNHELALNLANRYYSFMTMSDSFGSELGSDFFPELIQNIELDLLKPP